jgi:hypothetical protein
MKKRLVFFVLMLMALCGISVSAQTTLLIEAEHFSAPGGWQLDTQFVDIMGSPYLIAHGLGQPVANASTGIEIPEAAIYHPWVRTRNWVPGDWTAPGRFQLAVNGKPLPTIFGTEPGWAWQKGEPVTLPAGRTVLELVDLTGFDGRCDAIVLTTDPNYRPDNSSEPMSAWRQQLLGITTREMVKEYDLVVVGGGLSGMGSAIAAARMGLSVALIQDRPVLGGNGSSEIRVAPRGNYPNWLYPLGDLVKEFSPFIAENVGPASMYLDALREKSVRAEPNLDLFLEHRVYKVIMDGKNHIQSVCALSTREKAIRVFKGRYFADTTGHGLIGYWAGADYHMEDANRMGTSNLWKWSMAKAPVAFPESPWALPLTQKGFPYPGGGKGEWYWESGFSKHPLKDLEAIRDHNLRAVFGAWNAIKNHGAYADKDKTGASHANAQLDWVAYVGGSRETLQLLGDVVLSKEDILSKRQFPDACVIVTWGLDLHYPHPLYSPSTADNPFIARSHFGGRVDDTTGPLARSPGFYADAPDSKRFDRAKGYAIPYRCLYSRNIDNLFVPSRAMSVSHDALGTIRVMQTLGMCGVAIGRAAYVAKKHGTTPRGAYENHLDELKQAWMLPASHREPGKSVPATPTP